MGATEKVTAFMSTYINGILAPIKENKYFCALFMVKILLKVYGEKGGIVL